MNALRFRIVEFLVSPDEKRSEDKFFIEKGTPYREKTWWIFSRKKIVWEPLMKEEGVALSYKSFDESLVALREIKKQLPIYHEIK